MLRVADGQSCCRRHNSRRHKASNTRPAKQQNSMQKARQMVTACFAETAFKLGLMMMAS